jgi:hypothetical protein
MTYDLLLVSDKKISIRTKLNREGDYLSLLYYYFPALLFKRIEINKILHMTFNLLINISPFNNYLEQS